MVLGMQDAQSPFMRNRWDTTRWYAWHPYTRMGLGLLGAALALLLVVSSGAGRAVSGPATTTSTVSRTVTTTASPTTVTTTATHGKDPDSTSPATAADRGARSTGGGDQGWSERSTTVEVRCSSPSTIFLTGSGSGAVTTRVTGAASMSGGDSLRIFGPAGTYVFEVTDSGGAPRVDWTSTSSCS